MEILLILWMACGVVCYFIVKSKGYPNESCLKHGVLGFFFGFIWIIVVLIKKENPYTTDYNLPTASTPFYRSSELPDNSMSPMEELGKLFELKRSGAITEAEYEVKKQELLRK